MYSGYRMTSANRVRNRYQPSFFEGAVGAATTGAGPDGAITPDRAEVNPVPTVAASVVASVEAASVTVHPPFEQDELPQPDDQRDAEQA